MIPTITQTENKKQNPFDNIVATRKPNDYWLTRKERTDEYQPQQEDTNKAIKPTILINPEEARKTKNLSVIGLSIAGATILTAAVIFFLLKGGTKTLQKNFEKIKDYLERKVQKSKLKNSGQITTLDKAYIYAIKTLDIMTDKAQAANNFTSFKDLLFKKFMFLTKFTENIHESTTRLFEKVGRRTVINTYKSTEASIQTIAKIPQTNPALKTLDDGFIVLNGQRISKKDAATLAQRMSEELVEDYNKNFGQKALTGRYLKFKHILADMKQKFASMRVFWDKKVFQEFLADKTVTADKETIQNVVRANKNRISYSLKDMRTTIEENIIKLSSNLGYKDPDKIKLLSDIRSNIKTYAKNPTKNSYLKSKIIADIEQLTNNLQKTIENNPAEKAHYEKLLQGLSEIQKDFTEFKQGKLQDILEIYHQILPENEFSKIQYEFDHATKQLNKSIKIETDDFFSKLRDLSLGSAPTDMLTVIGGLGTLGYNLGKSEDNDERVSITLKYGIPALACIGTMLYCSAKLYAGSKSLIFSTISTFVTNQIGSTADNILKKVKNSKKEQESPKTTEEVKNPPKTV